MNGTASAFPAACCGCHIFDRIGKNLCCWFIGLSAILLGACAGLPPNHNRSPSYAFTDTGQTCLGRLALTSADDQSAVMLLDNGVDAFAARLSLIEQAERCIDVQYYLFHDDLAGRLLIDHLYRAAERGVRVRMLLDDIDLGDMEQMVAIVDRHPRIEVRVFNPFSRQYHRVTQLIMTADRGRVTRRMHNKAFIVDNQAAIVGSRNIGNSYFGADSKLDFQDLDVLAMGPAAHRISNVFDAFWNFEMAFPISSLWRQSISESQITAYRQSMADYLADHEHDDFLQALEASALKGGGESFNLQPAETDVLYDLPQKILHRSYELPYHLSPQLSPLFKAVQQDLIIISPYFVPGKQGLEFLVHLAARGVRVRILTNSLASTDVSIVHSGYAKYRKALLSAGIELYELNKHISRAERKSRGEKSASMASLHTKAIVFDRRKVFIGSLNLDPRAMEFNTEIGLVLTSDYMAAALGQWFDDNLPQKAFRLELQKDRRGMDKLVWHGLVDGRRQVFTKEPYSSVWRRLGIGLMSILPLESHL